MVYAWTVQQHFKLKEIESLAVHFRCVCVYYNDICNEVSLFPVIPKRHKSYMPFGLRTDHGEERGSKIKRLLLKLYGANTNIVPYSNQGQHCLTPT